MSRRSNQPAIPISSKENQKFNFLEQDQIQPQYQKPLEGQRSNRPNRSRTPTGSHGSHGRLKIFDPILNVPEKSFETNFFQDLFRLGKKIDLNDFSIFKPDDPQRRGAIGKIKGKVKFSSPAEDRAFGVIFGMTIGDAMGGRLEFQPVRYGPNILTDMGKGPGGNFKLQPGQWTDDSSMGFCLADSLIWNKEWKPHDCMQRFLAWWHCGYNNAFRYDVKRSSKHSVGLGGNISTSFQCYPQNPVEYTTAGDKNTSGNGSVMRLAAVPVYYYDKIEEGMKVASLQSKTTHQGDEAAECCRLLTFIIIKCINGEQIKDVLNNLGKTFKTDISSIKCLANSECEVDEKRIKNEDRNWSWKSSDFKYSPTRARKQPGYIGSYAMDATAMSLHCIWTTKSAQEAILKAVNLCGDSDSVGSVTGQLAGAAYGVSTFPKDWIKDVQQWDRDGDIALRAHYLFNKSYSQ